jgi:hypothetical protein
MDKVHGEGKAVVSSRTSGRGRGRAEATNLTASNEEDRLASNVSHRESSADFVVLQSEQKKPCKRPHINARSDAKEEDKKVQTYDRVKLCQYHPVHSSPSLAPPSRSGLPTSIPSSSSRKVPQAPVKLAELIDGLVPDEGFANKDDLIGLVDGDELGERAHERLVVLHPAGGVDEDDVKGVRFGWERVKGRKEGRKTDGSSARTREREKGGGGTPSDERDGM